jgi:hypothetical protein
MSIYKGLFEFLKTQNFSLSITAILNSSKSTAQIRVQQRRWFDGFRTLKLIHFLRDNYFPNINMYQALDIIFAKFNIAVPSRINEDIPSKEIQLQYLEKLRSLDSK